MSAYVYLIFFHFIADFVLQSRELGRGKSKNIVLLLLHVMQYTVVMAVLVSFYMGSIDLVQDAALFCLLNGLAHLVTDFFTSKASSMEHRRMTEAKAEDKDKHEHLFWCIIGFDQFAHVAVLILIYDRMFL